MIEFIKENFPGFTVLPIKRPSKRKEKFFEKFKNHKGDFYWGLTVDNGYGEIGAGHGTLNRCIIDGLKCLFGHDLEDSDFLWISTISDDGIIGNTGIAVYKDKTINAYSISKC